jgi:sugar phosphate isomerase/epimerase
MWDMSKIPPGLGLYTLRTLTEEDMFGILQKVSEMGYKTVEFFRYEGIPAARMKQALDGFELQAISSIFAIDELEEELMEKIKYSLVLGASYISFFIPRETAVMLLKNPAQLQTLISKLKIIGLEMKRHGLQFAYHPEEPEFEKIGGKFIYDLILEGVGRDLLQLELDMFWVKKAGLDPAATLLSYKGRVPLIHVKDMDKSGDFTEVGRGIITWPPIFAAAKEAGVKYYFVEQNESQDPLKSVEMSIGYLKSIGAA